MCFNLISINIRMLTLCSTVLHSAVASTIYHQWPEVCGIAFFKRTA